MAMRNVKPPTGITTMAATSVLALVLGSGTAFAAPSYDQEEQAEQQETERTEQSWSQDASSDMAQSGELQTLADEHDDISRFVEALKTAGMEESLTSGTYTVFAPTNDAYEQAGKGDELLEPGNREELVSLLRAHIVADDVDPQMARRIGAARTIDGGEVDLTATDDKLTVDEAEVVESGIQAGSLRIYAINQVLSPDSGAALASRTEGQEEEEAEE